MIAEQANGEMIAAAQPQEEESEISAAIAEMADLEQQARAFIRERPVAAVLAALGAGYLTARVLSRTPR